ncbi:hypothetical protein DY000_02046758 [Brassica cretica]|uniref:Uncharacterized protein n=1 Tax=Brassica cretica TaxID=69181 RepID=A0ABQ7F4K6_BRACR|nr:hypothetical protein DY000_02046758 [Brassica cretica]
MLWPRPSWNITTRPSTITVSVWAVCTRKLPCSPSKVRRSKESRASSPSSPLSLSSSANTTSPLSIVSLLVLPPVCSFSSPVISSSPARNTPSSSARCFI